MARALTRSHGVYFHCSDHIGNYVGKMSKKGDGVARHIEERETPLPLLLSIKVHMRTGKDSLVNMLAERGLSIS